jgi:hypothetical protein
MTFDLDAPTLAARDHARAAAARLAAAAATIDHVARIAPDARDHARAALATTGDRLAWVIVVEELAVVSGSLAVDAALALPPAEPEGRPSWSGLRGIDIAAARDAAPEAARDLAVAAVLIGLGRAALDVALGGLRAARGDGGKPEQQHWTVADAATELDAARLLLWRATASAPAGAGTAVAMARMQARTAAEACVGAARRVLGARPGDVGERLDRLTRDVATATLLFGGPDADESAVAAGVLPVARHA